jgi:hypothetical protein
MAETLYRTSYVSTSYKGWNEFALQVPGVNATSIGAMTWAYAVKAHGNAPVVPGQDVFTRPELFCTDTY